MIASTIRQLCHAAVPAVTSAVLVAVPAALGIAPARAADASAWSEDARAGMRLVAGSTRADDASLRAGIEVRLAPGWKTYWRYPGDSGVPPRFDFAGSANVKSVTVAWPAPHRFTDESGTSIGYKTDVVFPLRVVPRDRGKPVSLHLKLDYAVCEKLCVPAEGRAELALGGGRSALDDLLGAADASVPKQAKLGDGAPLAVRAVRREGAGEHARVFVDVAAPGPGPLDLFVEGPTAEWALPVPEPVAGAPAGLHRFAFTLDGVAPGANPVGALLTFTLVSGANAVEVTTRLD